MMTAKMSDKDTREDINKVFNLFDDDQTGHITLRNLKRVARELGETMSGGEHIQWRRYGHHHSDISDTAYWIKGLHAQRVQI